MKTDQIAISDLQETVTDARNAANAFADGASELSAMTGTATATGEQTIAHAAPNAIGGHFYGGRERRAAKTLSHRKTLAVAVRLQCNFCNTVFSRKYITLDMRCPKCREYDIDLIG